MAWVQLSACPFFIHHWIYNSLPVPFFFNKKEGGIAFDDIEEFLFFPVVEQEILADGTGDNMIKGVFPTHS
jgi:hypothetical protein